MVHNLVQSLISKQLHSDSVTMRTDTMEIIQDHDTRRNIRETQQVTRQILDLNAGQRRWRWRNTRTGTEDGGLIKKALDSFRKSNMNRSSMM